MNEFIIVFRESLEACLIVGIIFTLLEKNNRKNEIKQLWFYFDDTEQKYISLYFENNIIVRIDD